ncbi:MULTISPECIES: sensor histidine kinase [Streptomyces]|uniref:sensor histidine kinase n=1 Tax=Streptomyces TaxID=1883 RepID=UPI0004C2ADEF|nr:MULTISPECIES: sensor histidine kinase [Streptomyces]
MLSSRPGGSGDAGEPPYGAGGGEAPWSRTDALVTGGACAINLLSYVFFDGTNGPNGSDGRDDVTVAGVLLVALAAVPLLARRRHPVAALAAVLVLDATATLTVPLSGHFGAVLMVALYTVARACPGRVTAAAVAATAVLMALSQSGGRLPPWQEAVNPPLSALIVVGAALVVNRWQREVAANRRLLADRAVADERRRIARELHDIVAHHITTMQLMAGGARANLADPEVAREALVTLEASGRLALREMRQLLDVLRADDEPEAAPPLPQPGAEDLHRLVAESRSAGLPTEFGVLGPQRPLPPTVGLAVFRIVQEALTNARKHAGAARASVLLTYGRDRVTVEVRDDGAGGPPQEASTVRPGEGGPGGYGLIGMRERVALHGGTLSAGPRTGGGFAVVADLPLGTDETDEAAEAAVRHEGAHR